MLPQTDDSDNNMIFQIATVIGHGNLEIHYFLEFRLGKDHSSLAYAGKYAG